jgi:superfamily II DNA/RNA helicase
MLSGGQYTSESQEFTMINAGNDILISTPTRFLFHYVKSKLHNFIWNSYCLEHMYFDDLKYMVIDEADTLLDNPLDKKLHRIVASLKEQIQNKQAYSQIVLASATITKAVTSFAQLQYLVIRMDIDIILEINVSSVAHAVRILFVTSLGSSQSSHTRFT